MNQKQLFLMGQRIQNARRQQGMTQAQLAEAIDKSTHYVGQIERGETSMSLSTFVSISEYLNLSPNYLLNKNLIHCDVHNELNHVLNAFAVNEKAMITSILKAALLHLSRNSSSS